ncbi:unnamed protein product, partial [Rotaria magnacalcarata]
MSKLEANLKVVLQRINELSQLNSSQVRLIAISKTKPVEDIVELYRAGQRHFGENYVDELENKSNNNIILTECPEIRWHFVGHLQSNKINRVLTHVPNLDCIQTIDSLALADRLNNNLMKQSKKLNILLQINTSNEDQKSASKSIGSTDLMNMKRRMHLIASEAKTELKQNVYRNHTKFIETAKEVSSLESEVYQLHSLLADEKQLLNTVKELLNVENKTESAEASDNDFWETLLHHCQSLGLVAANPERRLIHSGKLLEVKLENLPTKSQNKASTNAKLPASFVTHQCYGLLVTDHFIIAKSSNIRTATAYDVDQVLKLHQTSTNINNDRSTDHHKQIQPSAIHIINVKDDVMRNSFAIKHNLETLTLMCESAQSKKHWLEMFESALYPRQRRGSLLYTDAGLISPSSSNNRSNVQQQPQQQQVFEEEFYSEDWITNTLENLIILLAERNFDEALNLILRARKYFQEFVAKHSQQSMPFVDEYIKGVQMKEQELCKLIEKEIQNICERGCSTNLLKHYYHHIQTLKQLGYVPKACDLFITIQLSLMKSTLKQTKLEELNVVFVENFANTFFTRLVDSYYEFVQIFKDQKSTFTKFIVWMSTEIEKLITI